MSTYWIRNRGRVQGPFTLDRIHGLLRRGRFSRHFHVSLDKKEWLPAEEFPELFGSKRRRGHDDDDDYEDTPFRGGGSPFDDDDEDEPPRRRKQKPKQRAAVLDDDDYEDEDEDDEDDWDDDEWDDEDEGLLDRLVGMVEANVKLIGGILVAVLGVLCWFVFFGESFAQDQADMDTLMEVNGRITTANATGLAPNDWLSLQEQIEGELASMVDRLESTATSQDHIKQELLFIARDDLATRFKELPNGIDEATKRIIQRFARIDEMIKTQTRQHAGSILTLPARRPPQQNIGNIPGRPGASGGPAESPGTSPADASNPPAEQPGQNSNIQPGSFPGSPQTSGNGDGTGNGGFLSNPQLNSPGNPGQPATPPNTNPGGTPPNTSPNTPAGTAPGSAPGGSPGQSGGIPGRPPKARFGNQ